MKFETKRALNAPVVDVILIILAFTLGPLLFRLRPKGIPIDRLQTLNLSHSSSTLPPGTHNRYGCDQ
jgi:hypothetical protein